VIIFVINSWFFRGEMTLGNVPGKITLGEMSLGETSGNDHWWSGFRRLDFVPPTVFLWHLLLAYLLFHTASPSSEGIKNNNNHKIHPSHRGLHTFAIRDGEILDILNILNI
jgi:hypothetical protein